MQKIEFIFAVRQIIKIFYINSYYFIHFVKKKSESGCLTGCDATPFRPNKQPGKIYFPGAAMAGAFSSKMFGTLFSFAWVSIAGGKRHNRQGGFFLHWGRQIFASLKEKNRHNKDEVFRAL